MNPRLYAFTDLLPRMSALEGLHPRLLRVDGADGAALFDVPANTLPEEYRKHGGNPGMKASSYSAFLFEFLQGFEV